MKSSIKDFFSKCDQIRRIWSHLLKKSLMENFNFCAVWYSLSHAHWNLSRTTSRSRKYMRNQYVLSHIRCNLTLSSKDEKICDQAVKENSWDLTNVSHLSQTNEMCNDAVSAEPCLSQCDPDFYE